jgi:hypothetical protein
MGNEAKCIVDYDGESAEAKVFLEADELIVRAPFRLKVPFGEMKKIDADDNRLLVRWSFASAFAADRARGAEVGREDPQPEAACGKAGHQSRSEDLDRG